MTPREAAITLNLIPGLGPVRVMRLMQVFASPELVLEAPASMLMDIPGIGAQLARHISSWRSIVNPYRELELADKAGATVTTVFDASYPAALRELTDAPIVLYSWGSWTAGDSERSIAVVGSRMATHYGRLCARTVSHDLAEAGVTVISGLARGVDTEAHTGALDAGGRTVAVIGAGLSKLYPWENRNLAQRIADGHGAVVSEFPMELPPSRTTFPMRNRIVSGWSRATLVVEASGRSGALITARTAGEQGREVFCIPGPVDRHSSDGCHALIRDGATLAAGASDILHDMKWTAPEQGLPLFPHPPFPPLHLRCLPLRRKRKSSMPSGWASIPLTPSAPHWGNRHAPLRRFCPECKLQGKSRRMQADTFPSTTRDTKQFSSLSGNVSTAGRAPPDGDSPRQPG